LACGIFASLEPKNVYKDILNNMVSLFDHVVMNHQNHTQRHEKSSHDVAHVEAALPWALDLALGIAESQIQGSRQATSSLFFRAISWTVAYNDSPRVVHAYGTRLTRYFCREGFAKSYSWQTLCRE
jgi:hypothetical protein